MRVPVLHAGGVAAQFMKFSLVGTIGFIVDAGVLYLMMYLAGLDPFLGRLVSFLAAASATWLLNRIYTFKGRSTGPRTGQWARFVMANAVGWIINYGVYSALLLTSDFFYGIPVLAVAIGSLSGLAFNFTVSRKFIFNKSIAQPNG